MSTQTDSIKKGERAARDPFRKARRRARTLVHGRLLILRANAAMPRGSFWTFCNDRCIMSIQSTGLIHSPGAWELCMARPRGFDETVALDAAIECFRRRGYEATSVRDLTACMGIGPTSFYNSFGDKRALFIKALERYVNCSVRGRLKRLESSLPPKEAVRTLIEDVVERSLTDRTRGGCLLINSALEIAPHDPEVGAEIAKRLSEIEGFFRRSIVAAQTSGTISRKLSPSDFARLLLSVLLGIR